MSMLINMYWGIGISAIIVYLLIHYFEIVPLLKKYNAAGILTLLTNLRHDRDLEKYKDLCMKNNKSLFWYHFLTVLRKITIPYIVGWFLFLLLACFRGKY